MDRCVEFTSEKRFPLSTHTNLVENINYPLKIKRTKKFRLGHVPSAVQVERHSKFALGE